MKKAPNRVPPRRSAGFTILELMITVTVLAILLGIGIPSFQDTIRRNRLAEQTNGLLGAFALARSEAVKRGMPVTVCPATDPINQNNCSNNGDWAANGLIIFTDRGEAGVVDIENENPEDNDAILQRIPPASTQNINIQTAAILLSYAQDGALPQGTPDLQFVLTPEDCRGNDGGRAIQVISAGRASARKVNCAGI